MIEGPGLIFFRFNRKILNDLCLCGGVKKFQNINFKIRGKNLCKVLLEPGKNRGQDKGRAIQGNHNKIRDFSLS
jgi:hypothetical protein